MEPKRSKYDTNPLDENVANRANESFGSKNSGGATEPIGGQTKSMDRNDPQTARAEVNEAPTRRMDSDKVTSYPSVFVPPARPASVYEPPRVAPAEIYQPPPGPPPSIYQVPGQPLSFKPGLNKVQGVGIPERWALLIPYIPAWLGVVAGFIELLLVPRSEARVRFHASQAIILQLGMTALGMLLTALGFISGRFAGASLFRAACFVFLIVAMVKVWKGKPFVIAPLEQLSNWLDEKINPRK